MPQPWREASQVMTTMRAEPVLQARKAVWSVLGTKGQSGQPRVANSWRTVTQRMKMADSDTAGGRDMTRS
jgi:hypothetical protein